VAATPAIAVREVIDVEVLRGGCKVRLVSCMPWSPPQRLMPLGPAGGMFTNDFFTHERGEATIYVPCADPEHWAGGVGDSTRV
jgi:hypothetical protein